MLRISGASRQNARSWLARIGGIRQTAAKRQAISRHGEKRRNNLAAKIIVCRHEPA
jgi:ferric-dicitrate binding protein FerR (iron transport regulator)